MSYSSLGDASCCEPVTYRLERCLRMPEYLESNTCCQLHSVCRRQIRLPRHRDGISFFSPSSCVRIFGPEIAWQIILLLSYYYYNFCCCLVTFFRSFILYSVFWQKRRMGLGIWFFFFDPMLWNYEAYLHYSHQYTWTAAQTTFRLPERRPTTDIKIKFQRSFVSLTK